MEFNIVNPKTKSELLGAIRKENHFRFGAGCTDLLMELKKKPEKDLTVINLSFVKDPLFTGIKKSAKGLRFGAMFTAHKIVVNEEIKNKYHVLHEAAFNLASTQIRQVATLGGNLCTASPSGDMACALVALQAECELMNTSGKSRMVPINDFLIGVRKTALKKNEVLFGVAVPANKKTTTNIHSGFIKIGTRRSMECSVVSLSYHVQLDKNGIIIQAGIAIGASAPTIRFAESACEFLIGKKLKTISQEEKERFADKVLSYASPITDIRATAWYRKEVLYNISKSILE
ncbi:MAG: FAD binding domain-containing protein [Bacteroidetes bacterium]|nr:FAD binding domain-containing protein [Bacteroidota bacterium]